MTRKPSFIVNKFAIFTFILFKRKRPKMEWSCLFAFFRTILTVPVDASTLNRICYIPEVQDLDDVSMLELSLIVNRCFYEGDNMASINEKLLSIYKSNEGLCKLLLFYSECIKYLFEQIESKVDTNSSGNAELLDLLMNIMRLCSILHREEYVSFHRDVDQLMSEYEHLVKMSTKTKEYVGKTYLLEHLTFCICKEVHYKAEYYKVIVVHNTYLMHNNALSVLLIGNMKSLNLSIHNKDDFGHCIEVVIDEAQLLNIIYDFEYKKHKVKAKKEKDAANTANFMFDDYIKNMFPQLLTSNRFTNIVYVAWTDVERKIDFYIRHARHNVLRDCSKQCFMDRLKSIKTHLNGVLLDKRHPLNKQDACLRNIIVVRSKIYIF